MAVEAARRTGGAARPLAVGAMVDEEGPRFGAAIFGSRALCGELAVDAVLARTDPDGHVLHDLAAPRGVTAETVRAAPFFLPRVASWIEVHVEQGRRLVDFPAALGVATSLAARERWKCTLYGLSDHAGTAAMAGRRDALVPAARVVLAAHELAAAEPGAVATVGRISALPGSTNQVPGEARLSLDVRATDQAALEHVRDGVQSAAEADGMESRGSSRPPTRAANSTAICARRSTRRRAPRGRSPSTSRPMRGTTRACSHATCRRPCCSCATRRASRTTPPRALPRKTAWPPARCSRARSSVARARRRAAGQRGSTARRSA